MRWSDRYEAPVPWSALHDHDPGTPAALPLLSVDGRMRFIAGMVLGIVLGVAAFLGLLLAMSDRSYD